MRIRNPYVQNCPRGGRHRRTRRALRNQAIFGDWDDELDDIEPEQLGLRPAPEVTRG